MQSTGEAEHEQIGNTGELVDEGPVSEHAAFVEPPFALPKEALLPEFGLGAPELAVHRGEVEAPEGVPSRPMSPGCEPRARVGGTILWLGASSRSTLALTEPGESASPVSVVTRRLILSFPLYYSMALWGTLSVGHVARGRGVVLDRPPCERLDLLLN